VKDKVPSSAMDKSTQDVPVASEVHGSATEHRLGASPTNASLERTRGK